MRLDTTEALLQMVWNQCDLATCICFITEIHIKNHLSAAACVMHLSLFTGVCPSALELIKC